MSDDDIKRFHLETTGFDLDASESALLDFARAIEQASRREALEEAIQIIETHRVPVGKSAAGEMAAGWTMDALHEIRDAIRALSQKDPQ